MSWEKVSSESLFCKRNFSGLLCIPCDCPAKLVTILVLEFLTKLAAECHECQLTCQVPIYSVPRWHRANEANLSIRLPREREREREFELSERRGWGGGVGQWTLNIHCCETYWISNKWIRNGFLVPTMLSVFLFRVIHNLNDSNRKFVTKRWPTRMFSS